MTNFELPSHVSKRWVVSVETSTGEALSPADFEFFGAATAPGAGAVAMRSTPGESQTVLTLSPLGQAGTWHYSIFCRQKLTAVTWQVAAGQISVTPSPCLAQPSLDPDPVLLTAMLDPETLQVTVTLGDSVAATAAAAQQATQAAAAAQDSQTAAAQSATDAQASKTAAAQSAGDAQTSKTAAAQSAADAQASKTAAAQSAADAQSSQTAAAQSATDAQASKTAAAQSAADAQGSKNAAAQSAADAQASKTAAAQSAADAQASQSAAAQSAADAQSSKAAAAQSAADAQASKSAAAQSAQQAADNAAQLGDAALQGGNNTFTGLNSFSGEVDFNNGIPWIAATAMALGVPPLAAYATTMAEYIPLSNLDTVTSGQSFSVFAPLIPKFLYADNGEYLNNKRFSGDSFFVVANVMNATQPKLIRAVTFSNTETSVSNPYRCEYLQLLHVGESCRYLILWEHNSFISAPNLNIYAPKLKKTATGKLINLLNSVGTAQIKLPSFNSSFTLKIGAMQKDDVLYLLQNLPSLNSGVSRTAAISCDPALESDEEFLAEVAAFYNAETNTGWKVTLSFQGNAIDAAATALALEDDLETVRKCYASREPFPGGEYVDASGDRWAVFSGSWVPPGQRGYDEFATLDDALALWGLSLYEPPVSENI